MYKTSLLTVAIALVMLTAPFLVAAETTPTETLQTEIQSLLTHIQALQVKIEGLLSGTRTVTTNNVPPGHCYAFGRSLSRGAHGIDVSTLQQFLMERGFAIPAGATGYFGAQTKVALAEWQVANNVVSSTNGGAGIFGPLSRSAFGRLCGIGGPSSSAPSVFSFTADPQSGTAPVSVTFTASAPITSGSSTFVVDFGDKSAAAPMTPGSCIAITAIVGGQGGIRCSTSVAHTYTAAQTYTARLMHDTCPAGAQCFVGPQTVATTVITVTSSTTTTSPDIVRLNAPATVMLARGGIAEIRNKNAYFTVTELTATTTTIQVTPVGCWNWFPSDTKPSQILCMIMIMPIAPVTLTVGQSYHADNYTITLTAIENNKATFSVTTSRASN